MKTLPKTHYDFRDTGKDLEHRFHSWSEFTELKWSDYVDNSAQSFNLGKGGDHYSHAQCLELCLPDWEKARKRKPIATYFCNFAVGAIFPTS